MKVPSVNDLKSSECPNPVVNDAEEPPSEEAPTP